jgi:hypothetical protein
MPDYVAHATKDRVDEGAAGILRAAQSHHKKRYMVRRLGSMMTTNLILILLVAVFIYFGMRK